MSSNGNCCCEHAHSVTSAHVDIAADNNGTLSDAFQFGDPTDTTWTLDGCTFAMDVQLTYYDAAPKLSLSSMAGTIVVDDTVQRVIHLSVDPVPLLPGAYVYDLVMTDALGTKTPLMHGALCISQGVTGV